MPKLIKPKSLNPYWQTLDGSVRLYHGDVIAVLKKLPSQSVHCVMTSPPYWALRNYGVEWQIGSEPTPQLFIEKMVEVFAEVHGVLRDDGTLWINLGDCYAQSSYSESRTEETVSDAVKGYDGNFQRLIRNNTSGGSVNLKPKLKIPSGNLLGMPWRVALALQDWGWILRSDMPWVKRSPMPESITNRPAKALEYVFMFAKKMGYYYDDVAVKKKSQGPSERITGGVDGKGKAGGRAEEIARGSLSGNYKFGSVRRTGDMRNFWNADLWFESVDYPHGLTTLENEVVGIDVTTGAGYSGAHFATFPRKLVEPCLLAGTSAHGCCISCGSPYRRVTDRTKRSRPRPNDYVKRSGEEGTGNSCANTVAGVDVRTLGWEKTCGCSTREVNPCTFLDPFIGSGTSCCVAIAHGRHSIGIDLSEKYLLANAIPRIEGELLNRGLGHLVERKSQ